MIDMLLRELKTAQEEELRLTKAEIEARNEFEQQMLKRQEKTMEVLRLRDKIDYMKRHG